MHNSNSRTVRPWNRGTERIFPSVSASVPSKYVIRPRYHPGFPFPPPSTLQPRERARAYFSFHLVPRRGAHGSPPSFQTRFHPIDQPSAIPPRSLLHHSYTDTAGLHNNAHKTRMRSSVPHCDTLTLPASWLGRECRFAPRPHLLRATRKMAKFRKCRSTQERGRTIPRVTKRLDRS